MFADTSCLHLRMHTWNSVVVYSLHSHRSVSGWMFLLVPAHPGSPRQRCGNGCVCVCVTWDPSHWAQLHLIEHSGAPHASWPPRHLRSCGLPSWTKNGQLANSRSSTPPARFGRVTDAAGPAHHGLGSLPIGVPIGDTIRRIRRRTPCVCVLHSCCVCPTVGGTCPTNIKTGKAFPVWANKQCLCWITKPVASAAESAEAMLHKHTQPPPHNRLMALCSGLPGWTGTRRNIHPLTPTRKKKKDSHRQQGPLYGSSSPLQCFEPARLLDPIKTAYN